MSPSARRLIAPALALTIAGSVGGGRALAADGPSGPFGVRPSAAQVLSRITARDALLDSYTVPVHVDVHLHKLVTLHFGMNGTQYYKRPDHLALELRPMPSQYRKLFGEIGTPLTWESTYDMHVADAAASEGHTTYRIDGVPRRPDGGVARMVLEVDSDATAPVRGTWTCTDGTTIAMSFDEQPAGPYQLPKHAVADLAVSGYRIHAELDYGSYVVNATVADSVFSGE